MKKLKRGVLAGLLTLGIGLSDGAYAAPAEIGLQEIEAVGDLEYFQLLFKLDHERRKAAFSLAAERLVAQSAKAKGQSETDFLAGLGAPIHPPSPAEIAQKLLQEEFVLDPEDIPEKTISAATASLSAEHKRQALQQAADKLGLRASEIDLGVPIDFPQRVRQWPKGAADIAMGPATAAVSLDYFLNLNDRRSGKVFRSLQHIHEKYPDDTRIVIHFFAESGKDKTLLNAAALNACAWGQPGFWPYLQASMDADNLDRASLLALAKQHGLDAASLEQCLERGASKARVHADRAEARRLGGDESPMVAINGVLFGDAPPAEDMLPLVVSELKAAPAAKFRFSPPPALAEPLTLEVIDAAGGTDIHDVKKQIDHKRHALADQMAAARLVEEAAGRQKMTVDQLLATKGKPAPALSEVGAAAALLQEGFEVAEITPEMLQARIGKAKQAGREAALLAFAKKLAAGKPVAKVAWDKPRLPDALREFPKGSNALSKGAANAPVQIIEYSDFTCGPCKRLAAELDTLVKLYPQDVRVVFRFLPLDDDKASDSFQSARAAQCAAEQGKFWPYAHALYEADDFSVASLVSLAKKNRLDAGKLAKCIVSRKPDQAIMADRAEAERFKARGTPVLFINGIRNEGYMNPEQLCDVVAAELGKECSLDADPSQAI